MYEALVYRKFCRSGVSLTLFTMRINLHTFKLYNYSRGVFFVCLTGHIIARRGLQGVNIAARRQVSNGGEPIIGLVAVRQITGWRSRPEVDHYQRLFRRIGASSPPSPLR